MGFHRILNIGNSQPIPLLEFIETLELALNKKAKKKFLPMQAGDVLVTSADTRALDAWVGFKPGTTLKQGVGRFVKWYREFYKI